MTDCQRGCLLYGQHTPDCTCTHECPQHDTHCEGCLPRPAEVGGYCQKCAWTLRDTITDIAELTYTLYAMPGGRLAPPEHTPGDDPTRRATRVDQHSPSPAHDAADEAEHWLHSWATAVADDRNERGPFQYRNDGIPIIDAYTAARYLTTQLAHITAAPYANDLTDEARKHRAALTRAAAADQGDQRLPIRCPACNQKSLIRPNGHEHVECRNRRCTARWATDTFGILAKAVS